MRTLFRYPALIVALALAATLFLAAQLPGLRINNDIEVFIPPDHPSKLAYERMEEVFGSQSLVDVAVHARSGSILEPDRVLLIRELTSRIRELPHVEEVTSLTSADYIAGTGEGMEASSLTGDDFTGTPSQMYELREKLFSWPEMYRRLVISEDFTSSQIIVSLERGTGTEQRELFYHRLQQVLQEQEEGDLEYHVAGEPVSLVLLKKNMVDDLTYLVPVVCLVVLLVLFLSFRRMGAVLLPMITVLMSTVWAVGAMPLLGMYFSMISTVVPVLLIAVGSAYVIHLFTQYYHEIQGLEGELSGDRHREAVFATLHRVGRPVLLAALTTAAGFGSLATSSIVPIRHFGIINAVGVLAAVLITLVFVPALLLLRRRTPRAARGMGAPYARGNSARAVLPRLLSAGRWGVLIAGAVVFVVAALGMTRIVVDNSILEYFDRDSEIRRADRFVSKQFAGGKVFSVIVGGAGAGSLTDPEALQAMDDLSSHLTGRHSQVGKVLSFSDFIKRMNKVMHYPELAGEPAAGDARGRHPGESEKAGGGPEIFWTEDEGAEPESFLSGQDNLAPTPEDAGNGPRPPARPPSPAGQLSAGDLLGALNRALAGSGSMNPDPGELVRRLNRIYNFRGEAYNEIPADPSRYPVEDAAGLRNLISQYLLIYSGNLDRFADDALEPSRARMIVQVRSTGTWEVRSIMDDAVRYARSRLPEGYEVDIAGYADMEAAVTGMIVRSQLLSVGAALVAVFLIVAVSFRSLSAGLFSIVPLSFAIVINFGLMGLAGITLDIATAMIASIAIGIGVDYAIHFLHRYRHERSRSRSPDEAAARTMSTTGKAIGFNALAVGAGFAVLLLSNFNPLRYVGLLTAVTMAVSGLAALTLLPVLLNLILPRFAGEPTAHGTHTSGRAPEGGGLEVPS